MDASNKNHSDVVPLSSMRTIVQRPSKTDDVTIVPTIKLPGTDLGVRSADKQMCPIKCRQKITPMLTNGLLDQFALDQAAS